MIVYFPGFLAACAVLITAASQIGRLVLLDPQAQTWPNAPPWLRHCMFVRTAAFVYFGWAMMFNLDIQARVSSWSLTVVVVVNAIVEVALLVHLLRSRHSPSLWARINSAIKHGKTIDALEKRDYVYIPLPPAVAEHPEQPTILH